MRIRAGFTGLGSQEKPISKHLARAGFEAAVDQGRR
jgi:3-hydroxyisobutyrate dehydrogenase-like beta-hydroxyacid dehydrogenase